MTRKELADLAGVTKGAITQAVDAGRIAVNPDGSIDESHPKTQSFLTAPKRQRRQALEAKSPTTAPKPAKSKPIAPPPPKKPAEIQPTVPTTAPQNTRRKSATESEGGESYNEAERRKMIAAADLGELKTKQLRGELVEREDVRRVFFQTQAIDASQILTLGQRIAADVSALFAIDDPDKILAAQEIIDIEARSALAQAKALMEKWLAENEEMQA